jgi:hypothetical protein
MPPLLPPLPELLPVLLLLHPLLLLLMPPTLVLLLVLLLVPVPELLVSMEALSGASSASMQRCCCPCVEGAVLHVSEKYSEHCWNRSSVLW